MNFDYPSLLTQIIGLIIVYFLLKKYAWEGILNMIEKRRQTIADEFDNIEKTKAETEDLKVQFEREMAGIEDTRRDKIQEAVTTANGLAAEIKDEARNEAVALREKTNADIELELDKANVTLRDRMVSAVITTSERVIKERLDSDKHKQLINDFLNEIDLKEGTR